MRATFEASRLGDLEFPEDAVHWVCYLTTIPKASHKLQRHS
jgi:hypothetical protein